MYFLLQACPDQMVALPGRSDVRILSRCLEDTTQIQLAGFVIHQCRCGFENNILICIIFFLHQVTLE